MFYDRLVRPVLFRLGDGDPEIAHQRTLAVLARLGDRPAVRALGRRWAVSAPRTVFGVRFPNPVGLAAGLDKNAVALGGWPALGFGHVEIGTVTRHAQPGNPPPRLFRLPASQALINRMGFNNDGAAAVAARLAAAGRPGVPVGISIGKSRVTPVAEAVDDYRASLRLLYDHADYFALNVSSPNTPGLRGLQDRGALDELVSELRAEADRLAGARSDRPGTPVPLLVKIAPDLAEPAIAEVIEVCLARGVAGLIATNTTTGRDGLAAADRAVAAQAGGLSGRPLAERAREVVAFVHRQAGPALPVVGVGGICAVDDALRLFDAGASLVQVYTGFIYAGPALVRDIARAARHR